MRNVFIKIEGLKHNRPALLRAWVAALVATAVATTAGVLLTGHRLEHPVPVLVLAVLAWAAERQSISLTPTFEFTVASILYIFAAVALGPVPAVVIGVAGLLADLTRTDDAQPVLRWLTWTSIRVAVVAAAGVVASAITGGHEHGFLILFAAVTAAFTVEALADVVLTPVAPAIRGRSRYLESVRSLAPALIGTIPFQAPFVAVLAYSYLAISPWSVALFAIPAVAAQRLHLLYRQQRETAEALTSANLRLESANLSFATALVATLDARDRYTAGHSAAVAIYARDIAKRMGLSAEQQRLVHLCGLVHDVGKIGLPAGLLEKEGSLSLDERRQMERHSEIGEGILRNVDDYAEIADVVRHHHERVDGNGYPDRLVGEEIPLLARIIAVADAYNAMTSDRPYRDAMPSRVARLRLAQAVETQFDTSVVAAFEAILAGASESYRMGTAVEFSLAHDLLGRSEVNGAPEMPSGLDDDLRVAAIHAAAFSV